MLKTVKPRKKPIGQSADRCLLLFLEQPIWMGGKRPALRNALILSSCIVPIYHLYLVLDQKNQWDITSLRPDPCLFQTTAGTMNFSAGQLSPQYNRRVRSGNQKSGLGYLFHHVCQLICEAQQYFILKH